MPLGYTRLTHIESSGTQYIDTGIIPKVESETKIELTFARVSHTQSGSEGFGSSANLNIANQNPFTYWRLNGTTTSEPIIELAVEAYIDGEYIDVVLQQTSSGRYWSIGKKSGMGSSNTVANTFCLGTLGGNSSYSFNGKYKSCKIYENDILVRDFIPAKRNSDNEVGLYDIVNNVFYTNAGMGDFVAGTEINNLRIDFTNDTGYLTASDIDNTTITQNSSDKLQIVAIIDQNGGIDKVWTGTQAEYDTLVNNNEIDADTYYNITDDQTASTYQAYTKSEVDALIQDALYYKAGDTFSFAQSNYSTFYAINTAGLLTTSQRDIVFSIVLPKRLDNISSISVNTLKTNIRGNGSYIPSGYTNGGTDATTFSTISVQKIIGNIVTIKLYLNTASTVTNNMPLAIEIDEILLTFS